MLSESLREQFPANEQAGAGEVSSFLLNNLGEGIEGFEVRAILNDIWGAYARQSTSSRGLLAFS